MRFITQAPLETRAVSSRQVLLVLPVVVSITADLVNNESIMESSMEGLGVVDSSDCLMVMDYQVI
jgi:hypothetical protein